MRKALAPQCGASAEPLWQCHLAALLGSASRQRLLAIALAREGF